jgi:hypothetical protein
MSCLLGEGVRGAEPSCLLETMGNPSVESSIMARSEDGDPLRVEPMRTASESLPLGERLRLLKRLAMNSRLSKQTVSPR